MSRLFTFGCSFTQYLWPTWANILGREFAHFENWGRIAAGNQFIFNSLIECHLKNQLGPDDIIGIMWTNVFREDRYVNNQWLTPGSIYNQTEYDKNFVKKFADTRGYYIRDLATIHATKLLLDSIGCRYFFLSMIPVLNESEFDSSDPADEIKDLLPYYRATIDEIRPSIFEAVFNKDWWSRPFCEGDLSVVKENYVKNAGADWPSFEDFINNKFDNVPQEVIKELSDTSRWNWDQLIYRTKRIDIHPTPLEHLEYIKKVLPEYFISAETKAWCTEVDAMTQQNRHCVGVPWDQHLALRW